MKQLPLFGRLVGLLMALVVANFSSVGIVAAVPATVPAPTLEFIASNDADADSDWEDEAVVHANYRLLLDTANGVTRQAVASSLATVTHAYDFPGGFIDNTNGGAQLFTAAAQSLQGIPGDPSLDPASFEIWFKPDTLAGGHQVLFEDGGGVGINFTLNNNQLIFRHLDATTNSQATFDITGLESEFIQAVGTIDTVSRHVVLYVNGQPAIVAGPSTADTVTDWTGGDAAGIGTRGGANMGGQGNGSVGISSFAGQITIFRFYEASLNAVEVAELYGDVAGTPVNYAHAGAILNFDATFDTTADSNWEDIAGIVPDYRLLLDTGNGVARQAAGSAYLGITHAYSFPGGEANGNTRGAQLYDAGVARSFENVPTGNASLGNASFEMWFRPDSLAGGHQVLLEDGGGTGIALSLNNNAVTARHLRGGQASQMVSLIADTAEFTHVIVTYSPNAGGTGITLYVNGVLVGNNANAAGLGDWTGGDAAAIATRGGANMGGYGAGNSGLVSFAGDVAIMRFYPSALDLEAVQQKYDITQVSPSHVGLAQVGATTAAFPVWGWFLLGMVLLGSTAVSLRRPSSSTT
ncbi:MAG: hypothetical protein OT477_18425 [Chloroflexi bacterium]|nr:hypothetical protein [Chloroflexota bacterium]